MLSLFTPAKLTYILHRIVNSRLFKFIVGEEVDGRPSEFYVHEEAIAQLSKPLQNLTKGSSPEARDGSATWKDVSKETFERFGQFAYTGDYSIPQTRERNAATAPPYSPIPNGSNGLHRGGSIHESNGTSTIELHDGSVPSIDNEPRRESVFEKTDDESRTLTKKQKKKKKLKEATKPSMPEPGPKTEPVESKLVETQPSEPEILEVKPAEPQQAPLGEEEESTDKLSQILVADFNSLEYPLIAPRNNYDGTCEPATDFEKDHSYSNVFLSHASLYALGDIQLIDSLKALALFKLHQTLCAFELDEVNSRDIVDLARYAYSEEGKGVDKGIGGLRNLVCQYMAIHAVELSGDPNFMNLLAEGGQVVKDFFKFQLQRIH
jgi:hypothetical protein